MQHFQGDWRHCQISTYASTQSCTSGIILIMSTVGPTPPLCMLHCEDQTVLHFENISVPPNQCLAVQQLLRFFQLVQMLLTDGSCYRNIDLCTGCICWARLCQAGCHGLAAIGLGSPGWSWHKRQQLRCLKDSQRHVCLRLILLASI